MMASDYACPKCGEIPHPVTFNLSKDYDSKNTCYKLVSGKLKLPLERAKPAFCCGEFRAIQYHETSEEYIAEIRKHIMFYAPTTEWIRDLIEEETNQPKGSEE